MKSLKINITNKLSDLDKIKINTLSNEHRLLYNGLLNFIKESGTSDFRLINQKYVELKNNNFLTINAKSAQNTCRSLINNIKSFYALHKKDKTAKFPYKFKSWKYFTSFMYDVNITHSSPGGGFKFIDNFIIFQKGLIKIDLSNHYFKSKEINNETIKTVTFTKDDKTNKYFICFTYSEKHKPLKLNDNFLSIDLGVSNIASCYSNIISPFIIRNNKLNKLDKTVNLLKSKRDKCKKRSRNYKNYNKLVFKYQTKRTNKNKDFQHKTSKKIIDICIENNISNLIVGDIKTKSCVTDYNKTLNKSTQNNGYLSRFKTFLQYKSKNVGIITELINEAYTSQTNCLTGQRTLSSDLSVREVELKNGFVINRDINSAVNIAKKSKQIGLQWLSQIEETLQNGTSMMFLDYKSNLKMSNDL